MSQELKHALFVGLAVACVWLLWREHTLTLELDGARADYVRCRGGAE